jgi:type II secretion system protein J
MTPTRTSRSARAFTLVEILIAMGILSLILAAIYSSWTAILRASKVGRDAAAAVQRARMAGRIIDEALGSAMLFSANPSYYAFIAENGDRASLSFVARLSSSFPRQGRFEGLDVRRLTFALEPGRDGSRNLVLRQRPLVMEMDEDERQYPLVLATHVKELKSEFWDPRLDDWIDEWKQTNSLPTLVKVTLKLGDNNFSTQAREQITRIVSLPAIAVAPMWQVPRVGPIPGQPGGPGGQPGQPGGQPGTPGLQPGQPGYQPGAPSGPPGFQGGRTPQ